MKREGLIYFEPLVYLFSFKLKNNMLFVSLVSKVVDFTAGHIVIFFSGGLSKWKPKNVHH